MRFLVVLFLVLPLSTLADEVTVNTRVTEVTMHPDITAVRRTGQATIPKGQHRLVLLGIPNEIISETLRVNVDGVEHRGLIYRSEFSPPRNYKSEQVKAAEDAVKAVELKIQRVQDQASQARLAANASRTTIGFLSNLGHNEGLAQASPDTLRDIARMISQESLAAGQTAHSAEVEAVEIERQLDALNEELGQANAALKAIALEDENRMYLAVDVDASQETSAKVTLNYMTGVQSVWAPVYDMNLVTGDTTQLHIKRDAVIQQFTGENWQDITLHLSTLTPVGQARSSTIYSYKRDIFEPAHQTKQSAFGSSSAAAPSSSAPDLSPYISSLWLDG